MAMALAQSRERASTIVPVGAAIPASLTVGARRRGHGGRRFRVRTTGGRAAARDRGGAGEGRDRGRPGVAGAVTARHGRAGMVLLARLSRERAAGVFQSRKTKVRPVPASGPGGRGCVPDVPAPVRTAGGSAAAPVDQEGGHGERHEDAPWAVPAMAGAVPEAAALPRPGAWNVSFPVARPARGRTA